jgi:hypothetical protein
MISDLGVKVDLHRVVYGDGTGKKLDFIVSPFENHINKDHLLDQIDDPDVFTINEVDHGHRFLELVDNYSDQIDLMWSVDLDPPIDHVSYQFARSSLFWKHQEVPFLFWMKSGRKSNSDLSNYISGDILDLLDRYLGIDEDSLQDIKSHILAFQL